MNWRNVQKISLLFPWVHFFKVHAIRRNPKSYLSKKFFSYFVKMEHSDLLSPPESVSGMKILDKNAFIKTVKIPFLEVNNRKKETTVIISRLKKYLLKLVGISPVQTTGSDKTKILFNPNLIKSFSDFDENISVEFKNAQITSEDFGEMLLTLTYDNWKADMILKAVLPQDKHPLNSYSLIGHIIHLNLKDHLLDYKYLIAQVLLDKVPYAKTVVHKVNTINNIYRNFEMEILCGDTDLIVKVIEYGVKYEFDFSKVYWNPRLSTEHDRIISLLNPGDALLDLFAGVGPFSIRAALKKCLVFANDLNPDSFKWLNHNIRLNKKSQNYITTYNKDGKDFILEDIKGILLKLWNDECFCGKIHFVMNLPASSLQFLKYFRGLLTTADLSILNGSDIGNCLPTFHCYFFVKEPETIIEVFEKGSQIKFDSEKHKFHFVRNVSAGKGMYRVTFDMPKKFLVADSVTSEEPLPKRICS